MAYGATKEDGELIGEWWSEDRDGCIQPAEFLLGAAAWCLAPWMPLDPWDVMGPDEAVRLITDRENRR